MTNETIEDYFKIISLYKLSIDNKINTEIYETGSFLIGNEKDLISWASFNHKRLEIIYSKIQESSSKEIDYDFIKNFKNHINNITNDILKTNRVKLNNQVKIVMVDNKTKEVNFLNYKDQIKEDIMFTLYSSLKNICDYSAFSYLINNFTYELCNSLRKYEFNNKSKQTLDLVYNELTNILIMFSNLFADLSIVYFNIRESFKFINFFDNFKNDIKISLLTHELYSFLFKLKSIVNSKGYFLYKSNLVLLSNILPSDLDINPYFSLDVTLKQFAINSLRESTQKPNTKSYKLENNLNCKKKYKKSARTSLMELKYTIQLNENLANQYEESVISEIESLMSMSSEEEEVKRKRSFSDDLNMLNSNNMNCENVLKSSSFKRVSFLSKFQIMNRLSTNTMAYESVINKLKSEYFQVTLLHKLNLFTKLKQLIIQESLNFWEFIQYKHILKNKILENLSFNADNSLLLISYIIIKANINEIYIDFQLINDLLDNNLKLNEEGYLLNTILSSNELINNYLDGKYCEANREQYMKNLKKEKNIISNF